MLFRTHGRRRTATEKRIENANLKATRLKPILERVNPDGSLSLHRLAKALNQEEIPTMSGKGQWNAKSGQRVYKRIAALPPPGEIKILESKNP